MCHCEMESVLTKVNAILRSRNRVVIIGISGVTCSGKSSLVNLFREHFKGVKTFCQDDFYFPCDEFDTSAGASNNPNFDSVKSVDMESFTKQVFNLKSEILGNPGVYHNLIILDGFSLFNHEPLSRACDLKYFITLSYHECLARRKKRNRSPPEPYGYFERIAWPMYISNLEEITRTPTSKTIQYLDGNSSSEEKFLSVIEDISKYLFE